MFEILSVQEDSDRVDRLSASYTGVVLRDGFHFRTTELQISVSNKERLTIVNDNMTPIIIDSFGEKDIDSLIEYFQDAKQFIREARLIKKLSGK